MKKEELEQLLYEYLPSCPLCRAETGYKIAFLCRYLECNSCGARWSPWSTKGDKRTWTLRLLKSDREERAKFLVNETKSVGFWQSLDLERQRERDRMEKEIEESLTQLEGSLKSKDEELRAEARNRLKAIGQPVFQKICEAPVSRAIMLLALMEDEIGIDFLVRALKTEPGVGNRRDAAAALGWIEKANKSGGTIEPQSSL